MNAREFRQKLVTLAGDTEIDLSPAIIEPLATYFEILARWNSKINLTSLPLRPPSDDALRRLVLEPLEAAKYVHDGPERWFDIGSGGGSPAVPMKLARPKLMLSMVESKTRKVAFLRELIRELGLSDTTAYCERLEDLSARPELQDIATLVTLRAIRPDDGLARAARRLMTQQGELWIFCSANVPELSPTFSLQETAPLGTIGTSSLARYAPAAFHVEQKS